MALMTYRVHKAMGQPVENTLHDLRWGDIDRSRHRAGLCLGLSDLRHRRRPAHFIGGWAGASSERQPPMYFRLGRRHAQGHQPARRNRLEPHLLSTTAN